SCHKKRADRITIRPLCIRLKSESVSSDVLVREVPVRQVIQEGTQEVRTTVLVIQVVSVFPHVAYQYRLGTCGQRSLGVRSLDHFQFAAIQHQPYPAAAELAHASVYKFFFEVFVAAEVSVDFCSNCASRCTATVRLHAGPE